MNAGKFFIIFILFTVNCSSYGSVNIISDNKIKTLSYNTSCNFTDDEKKIIKKTFHYFSEIVNFSINEEYCINDGEIYENIFINKDYNVDEIILGTADIGNLHITLYNSWENLNESNKENVLKHEILHLFGLGHVNYTNCLMYPQQNIQDDDILDLCDAEYDFLRNI